MSPPILPRALSSMVTPCSWQRSSLCSKGNIPAAIASRVESSVILVRGAIGK